MSNMIVVTPLLHQQITDPKQHFGSPKPSNRTNKGFRMTREELLTLIHRMFSLEESEDDESDILNRMDEAFPNAEVGKLIYWTTPELEPEQIVDEVFRRELEHARGKGSAANEA